MSLRLLVRRSGDHPVWGLSLPPGSFLCTRAQAQALLATNLTNASASLEALQADVEFLRDQINTTEVQYRLYCAVLYCAVLHCTALCYTVLCAALYCTAMYSPVLEE